MTGIETLVLAGAILVLACVALTRFFDWLGVPVLLLFLGVGMVAGAEGYGGLSIGGPGIARSIGIFCLVLILFGGGLDTVWSSVRPVLGPALSLSTVGVALTAIPLGLAACWVLDLPLWTGFLLGAMLSSTDASAVFSILRSRDIRLRPRVRNLLELESGINDPMAVFLTVVAVEAALDPRTITWGWLLIRFGLEMAVGALVGIGGGWILSWLTNRLKARQEGLYPVFALAWAFLLFGLAAQLHGSGFLAVFLAGMTAGHRDFVGRRSTERFFDGLTWLAQIVLFLILGIMVHPSELFPLIPRGLVLTLVMLLLARPLAVLVSLAPFGFGMRESVFVGWVGLRGAVPLVLATYPLLAGVPHASSLLIVVFLAVGISALAQGTTLSVFAERLGILDKEIDQTVPDSAQSLSPDIEEIELMVPFGSVAAGRPLVELHLPAHCRIVMIGRGESLLVPDPEGGTILQEGDILQVLASPEDIASLQARLMPPAT
ncbi:MAG: potassium/proton antiporter [Fibrobacteria bacterium]|nr:potassium/proton antiporter [Fibrobacteria bacterium]